jgi:hypothetical protein
MRKNGVLGLNFGFFDFGKNPDLTSNLTLISNFQILGIDARQNFTGAMMSRTRPTQKKIPQRRLSGRLRCDIEDRPNC